MLAQDFSYLNAGEWNDAPDIVAGIYGVVEVPAPVPEPGTMLLFGSGLFGLVGYNCRSRKQAA
ncbi:hypothetical protein GF1_15310 [Desulfolithobacter dissulfuricans]|uniref:Ice-binding protein C-terminal domain-containing protein n=1 Tax=Desulfolithobacter dissulfuricans TaxID=2795293 RepID=A0A915UA54_9BACT|nr:hypothetical protein GF1_15310 [Desulfolithobacter dissulfuricans]